MITKKNGVVEHKTLFFFSNIKLNCNIDSNMFNTRRLDKGL